MAGTGGADLVVRVAANISALQADMTKAVASIKTIEGAVTNASEVSQRWDATLSGLKTQLAGMFTVGAVIAFGRELLADADALVKLSDKTGVSIQWLQKFQVVGDEAGNTVGELTAAITQMQNRLAGDDKSAVAALGKLHLNLASLKALSPDQQFVAIADAIRRVQDPAERVNLAMDLFGRQGANILPTIVKGFDDVRDHAVGMKDETVHALDSIGDASKSLWRTVKDTVANATVDWAMNFFNPVGTRLLQLETEAATFEASLAGASRIAAGMLPHGQGLGVLPFPTAGELRQIDQQFVEHKKRIDEAAVATKKLAEANQQFRDSVNAAAIAMWGGIAAMNRAQIVVPNLTSQQEIFDNVLQGLTEDGLIPANDQLGKFNRHLLALDDIGHGPSGAVQEFRKEAQGAGGDLSNLSQAFANFATVSGDSLSGAVRVAGQLQTAIHLADEATKLLSSDTKLSTTQTIAVFSSYAGLIQLEGKALNYLAEGLNHWMGIETGQDIVTRMVGNSTAINDYVKKLGGIDEIMRITGLTAEQVGHQLQLAFNAKTPAAFADALRPITGAMAHVIDLEHGVDGLVAAFQHAGTYIPKSMIATLQSLIDMGTLTDDEKAKLQGLVDAAQPDFAKLTELAKTYGISLGDLGPAFEQADIDSRARTIFNDFSALIDAGGNADGILHGMAGSISKLVGDSFKFATAIPENMRPWIQHLIDTDQLVLDNGTHIHDINDIKFEATPLDKGLGDLNTALGLLDTDIKNLTTSLGIFLSGVPTNPFHGWVVPSHDFSGLDVMPPAPNTPGGSQDFPESRGLGIAARGMGSLASRLPAASASRSGDLIVHNHFDGAVIASASARDELVEMITRGLDEKLRSMRRVRAA